MFIFFIRRFAMILVLTMLPSYQNIQAFAQLGSTGFVIFYISHERPFVEPSQNRMERINELSVLMAGYTLLAFSDWVGDIDRQYEVGWILVSIIALNICYNFGSLAVRITEKLKTSLRIYKARRNNIRMH